MGNGGQNKERCFGIEVISPARNGCCRGRCRKQSDYFFAGFQHLRAVGCPFLHRLLIVRRAEGFQDDIDEGRKFHQRRH